MSRPKLLDGCCCEGGAAAGYERAGFDVYGIDLFERNTRKRYRPPAYRGDIVLALTLLIAGHRIPFTHLDGRVEWLALEDFAAIHVSPPCQGYTIATAGNLTARNSYQRLIPAVRNLLMLTGKPWVIENVEQALSQMRNPVLLCGRMFGLEAADEDGARLVLDRHRLFEASFPIVPPMHMPHDDSQVAGVYGGSRRAKRRKGETLAEVAPRDRHAARHVRKGGYVPRSHRVQSDLLGIDWMTVKGRQESIPPVYAHLVGAQLLTHIESERAA